MAKKLKRQINERNNPKGYDQLREVSEQSKRFEKKNEQLKQELSKQLKNKNLTDSEKYNVKKLFDTFMEILEIEQYVILLDKLTDEESTQKLLEDLKIKRGFRNKEDLQEYVLFLLKKYKTTVKNVKNDAKNRITTTSGAIDDAMVEYNNKVNQALQCMQNYIDTFYEADLKKPDLMGKYTRGGSEKEINDSVLSFFSDIGDLERSDLNVANSRVLYKGKRITSYTVPEIFGVLSSFQNEDEDSVDEQRVQLRGLYETLKKAFADQYPYIQTDATYQEKARVTVNYLKSYFSKEIIQKYKSEQVEITADTPTSLPVSIEIWSNAILEKAFEASPAANTFEETSFFQKWLPTVTEWVDRHEAYLPGTDEREKLSKRFLEMHDEIAYWDIDHAPILGYRVENSEDFEGVPEMKQSEITEERDLMSMSFLKICFTGGDDGTNKFHWVGLIPENTPFTDLLVFARNSKQTGM